LISSLGLLVDETSGADRIGLATQPKEHSWFGEITPYKKTHHIKYM